MKAPVPCSCLLALAGLAMRATAFETVVIDPGHGGNDEGTEWRRISEKDLTLAVARRLERILRDKHVQAVLTRHCDSYVTLDERVDLADQYPNSLLLSIHFNGSRQTDIRGFEIYAFRESPSGRCAAESIQRAMAEKLLIRNRGLRTNQDYAVLARSAGPAVLVECGFISNKTDAARLATADGQQQLAEALALGILRVKPLINFDPPEADLAKCEIHARKFDPAQQKADAKKRVTSFKSRGKSKPKKKSKHS